MSDNFINSFCKVQFLCYEGEPNWLGLIVLFPLVIIFGSIIVVIFGGIFGWLSDIGENINNGFRNFFRKRPERKQAEKERKQAEKERKQAELEQLNRKQRVFRVVSLPFRWTGNVISTIYQFVIGLVIVLAIIGLVVQLIQGIYNYIV